jgi:DNA-binding SARP family transcriptional activator
VRDGFVMNMWTYYEPVPPRQVPPAHYAHALERLHAGIIDRAGERYQADPAVLHCDLWRFQAALADATAATEDPAVIAALQRATAAHAGDLVDGTYYEWAEAPREDLRRRAVDAAARLAELHQQTGDPNAALAALDHAVTNDPYTEELYRRTMRIQAGLSRPDAVRRTYRLLETRLADLDVEPDDTTDRLLHKLLGRESSTEPRTMTAAAGGCQ